MKKSSSLFLLSLMLLSSCGYSKEEGKAADDFCMCASNKSFLQKADCIDFATGLNNVEKNSVGFKRAVKEKCPESFKAMKENALKYKEQSE